jgi:Tfp pilus assembly protein PilX
MGGAMTLNTHREQGVALVTALILLLVMTILGVSTVSTASMEVRMAANDQFLENAFQAAETGLDGDMARLNTGAVDAPAAIGNQAAGDPPNCSAPVNGVVPELGGTFTTTLCFMGTGGMPEGYDIGKYNHYMFQNDSQGVVAMGQANSLQSLGMSIVGPK